MTGPVPRRLIPRRSSGVLLSGVEDGFIVYDLTTETVHRMNETAGAILLSCDGMTPVESVVREWAGKTGSAPGSIAVDIESVLTTFEELGLVGRRQTFVAPEPLLLAGEPHPGHIGLTHTVIDHAVAFRSRREDLVEKIDAFLGFGRPDVSPTVVFDIVERPSGAMVLTARTEQIATPASNLVNQAITVMNELAAVSSSCLTLHAAGVRSPTGRIVTLPAPSGSGKSTLAAALLAAGWDYLGDEAIGIRPDSCIAVGYPKPLALDRRSRRTVGLADKSVEEVMPEEMRPGVELLMGNAGAVDQVILPKYFEGAEAAMVRLSPSAALVELLTNTLNLAHVGQRGLDALCDIAESVPVHRMTYGHLNEAIGMLEGGLHQRPK